MVEIKFVRRTGKDMVYIFEDWEQPEGCHTDKNRHQISLCIPHNLLGISASMCSKDGSELACMAVGAVVASESSVSMLILLESAIC